MNNKKAFNARNPKLSNFPLEVNIETVFGCNLRCGMCIMKDLKRYGGGRCTKLMESAVFEKVVEQVSDKPRTICLNQNGEPLLHPEIVRFVASAKTRGHYVYFVTNGTRLNENLARGLIDAGLDRIIFSIDGIQKEVYEKIRVGADFNIVMTNALRFIEMSKVAPREVKVEIHCILSDLTQPHRGEIEQFWKNKAQLVFLPFDDWGGLFDGAEVDFGNPRTKKNASVERYPCDYLWTSVNVSAEGRVMYCCHDYKLASELPTVMEMKLIDIWREGIFRERDKHVKNAIDALPCSQCDTWTTRSAPCQTSGLSHAGRLHRLVRYLISRVLSPGIKGGVD